VVDRSTSYFADVIFKIYCIILLILFLFWFICPLSDAAVKHANWDTRRVRDKLKRDIDAYAGEVRSARLAELKRSYEVFRIYY
jgi:hypothetical protein